MRFILQVDDWSEWKNVSVFSQYNDALAYGHDELPENSWRIIGDYAPEVLYQHDPIVAFGNSARNDINRMRAVEEWMANGKKRYTPKPKKQVKETKWCELNVYALKVALNKREERLAKYEQFNWKEEGF